MLNPRHFFLSFINHASRLDRVRFAINFSRSIAGKVARFGKFERMTLPRMTPLLIFDVYGRMRISPSQFPRFLNSSIPSSPFLSTPSSIQPPWNKYNERDVPGVEREISYTRLRDRYSWLPARNTGVGKASGNVETPRSLTLLAYSLLFVYLFLNAHQRCRFRGWLQLLWG